MRRLLKLKPPETVEVLVRFLPFAGDEVAVEEIWFGVHSLTEKSGMIDAALTAAFIVSTAEARWKGGRPESISYRIAPSAKMSALWSADRPWTCSGAM